MSRVQLSALFMDTVPCLFILKSSCFASHRFQNDRLSFLVRRGLLALAESLQKPLPPLYFLFALSRILIMSRINVVNSLLLIPCRQRFLFFTSLTIDYSSSFVGMQQYCFSLPVTTLPSSRLSIVLLLLIKGNSPVLRAA